MHFLQSPAWEAFQQALGRRTHRVGGVLVIEHPTPLGSYWYLGRPELTSTSLDTIVTAAKQQGVLFVRVDPDIGFEVGSLGTRHYKLVTTLPTQPQTTLVRRIDLPDDELLASFKEKTRYNVRLAQKKGVTVRATTNPDEIELFTRLAEGTGVRQDFRYHGERYYRMMLAQSQVDQRLPVKLLIAESEGQPVAALILLVWEQTAYYLHGASNHAARAVMAPHLLQFEAMRLAREAGATSYDFWGVAPPARGHLGGELGNKHIRGETRLTVGQGERAASSEEYTYNQNHTWAGVTRFKLGFGGEISQAPDSFNIVLDPPKYQLYTVLRRLRRLFA